MKPVVTYVIEGYPPETVGGAQIQAHRVARLLTDEFHMRTLTTAGPGLPEREVMDGVHIYRVPFGAGVGTRAAALDAARVISYGLREVRPRIVQGFQVGGPTIAAACLAYLRRARLIIKMTHRYNFEDVSTVRKRKQLAFQIHSAAGIVVPSLALRDLALEADVAESKLHYIVNGVDVEFFHPANQAERNAARGSLGYKEGDFVFAWIARLDPFKGLDSLLPVWGEIDACRPEARLLLVCDGDDEAVAQELAATFPASVKRLHLQRDVRPFFHAADALLLTSRAEGLSNTLLEGLACGLPAVVANAPENVEVGGGGDFMMVYDFSVPSALGSALMQALEQRAQRPALADRARKRIESFYSLDATATRWADLYRSLL